MPRDKPEMGSVKERKYRHWGTAPRPCHGSAYCRPGSEPASQPIAQTGGNQNRGRDKFVQENCDSKLITSVRAFWGLFT